MIVLEILKIIGIVLGCIVGLVLLILLLVLFAPVSYRLKGDGVNADIKAEARATWLLGLLSASIQYADKKLPYGVKIAGIFLRKGDLLAMEKKPEKEEPEKTEPEKKEPEKEEPALIAAKKNPEQETDKMQNPEVTAVAEEKKEKEDLSDRIEHFFEKVAEKNNSWTAKIEEAEKILTSKVTARAWKKVKEELFNILNHIKPKKIEGNLNFGLEDPANTAIIYGTIDYLAIAMSEGKLIITPEFYQTGIALDMIIHGRIFLGYIVLCALRVLFHKDVRRVFRVIRRVL